MALRLSYVKLLNRMYTSYLECTLLISIRLSNLEKISQHLAETFMLELISLHDILIRAKDLASCYLMSSC